MIRKRLLPGLVVILFFFAGSSRAQTTGSIAGTLQDTTGAVIPGATVIITNSETGSARSITTDDKGYYQALSLQVGRYQVSAEKEGFKTALRQGINLVVGQQAVINLSLEVGQVQELVTVTAEAPVVNTTTSSTAGLVEEKEIKELPLNGRSYDQLITLNPGTTSVTTQLRPTGTFVAQGYLFNVNGSRSIENLFTLNGIEFTGVSKIGTTPGGASGQLLGVDAVREFSVQATTYGVEYGKRSGGQVNVITQSGTNGFHGTLFEFLRNSYFDAPDFFDNAANKPKSAFRRNDFGAAAGGPIRKDKTFIFGNYEGYRQSLTTTNATFVPDANARLGLLPIGAGCSLVNVGVAKGVAPYFAIFPAPNGPELPTGTCPASGIAQSFDAATTPVREDYGNTRLDHYFSEKDSFSAVYTIDDGKNVRPLQNPTAGTTLAERQQVLSLQETHTFSPSIINTARVGFSRAGYYADTVPLVTLDPGLPIVPGYSMGSITLGTGAAQGGSGISAFGGAVGDQEYRNLFTYTDAVQIVKGRHQLSAGFWAQRIQANTFRGGSYGSATFSGLPAFLQGLALTLGGGGISLMYGSRQWEASWYVADTVRVTQILTLTLGLRHEFTNGWHEVGGRLENHLLGPNGAPLSQPLIGSTVTANGSLRNFAPRIGLAWDVFGTGKTVLHAGFGTYYNQLDDLNQYLTEGYPLIISTSLSSTNTIGTIPFPQYLPILPPGSPLPAGTPLPSGGFDYSAKTPVVQQWSFTIEQQITPTTGLSVGYVGSHGYHNLGPSSSNPTNSVICPAAPCPASLPGGTRYFASSAQSARLNPAVASGGPLGEDGHSDFNSLQVDLKQKPAKGVTFRANYAFSKALDNVSGLVTGYEGNCANAYGQANNPNVDWSPACYDIRHRFSLNGSYDLPIGQGQAFLGRVAGVPGKLLSGWQLNGIFSWQTGLPFSPLAGIGQSRDGSSSGSERASWNPSFTGPLYPGTLNQWFNPNAFVLAPAGTYGNAGRNVLRGPRLANADVSLYKATKLSERFNLAFRAEFFNILNHPSFGVPNHSLFSTGGVQSGTAGVINNVLTFPREIQLGLKLSW